MYDWKEMFICDLLDCGTADLSLLDDCKYDICDLADDCKNIHGYYGLNEILRIMFETGISEEIEQALDHRICILEAIENERELDEDEKEELDALSKLDPWADIETYENCLDTHVWIEDEDKAAIYKEYLPEALDSFYEKTGFEISTD